VKLRQREGRRNSRESGQVATYLPHLIESTVVNARLLKVILRRLDHLLHDLLVDIALVVAVSKPAFTLPPLARAPGILTTTVFDMFTNLLVVFSYLVYGIGPGDAAQRLAIVARVQRVGGTARSDRRRQRLRLQMGSRALEEAFARSRITTDMVLHQTGNFVRRVGVSPTVTLVGCMSDSERPSAGN
jgi:hypothetical protein